MAQGAPENSVRRGLEGVLAAKTKISRIDREACVLRYAGYDATILAEHGTYEDVCHLLWTRRLPSRAEREELQAELASYRDIPRPVLRMLTSLPRDAASMTALRTAISALGAFDPDADDLSPEAALRKSKRIVAQVAVVVAAWPSFGSGLSGSLP
jgi:citrate synthase